MVYWNQSSQQVLLYTTFDTIPPVVVSATPRPYILKAMIEKHVQSYQEVYLLTTHLLQKDI